MKRIRKKLTILMHAMKGIGRNIKDFFLDILLPCTYDAFIIGCIFWICVTGGIVTAIVELLKYLLGR